MARSSSSLASLASLLLLGSALLPSSAASGPPRRSPSPSPKPPPPPPKFGEVWSAFFALNASDSQCSQDTFAEFYVARYSPTASSPSQYYSLSQPYNWPSGNPASYDRLKSDWEGKGRVDTVAVAEGFVRKKLKEATKAYKEAKKDEHPSRVPVYNRFKTADALPANVVTTLPADKVLRLLVKETEDDDVVVPSSPAMAFVMRYSVDNKSPPLDVVRRPLGRSVVVVERNVLCV